MDAYGIFFVGTARTKPGKAAAAAQWWGEKGYDSYRSLPGVKSLRTYAGQFGLSGDYGIEFWYEVDNYAVMDRWDEAIAADPQEYGPLFEEFAEFFDVGPSRMMGDWLESRLVD